MHVHNVHRSIIHDYLENNKKLTLLKEKTPILKNWTDRDCSASQIDAHNGNLGWVLSDGDLVIDVDPRNGGEVSYKKLEWVIGEDLYKTVKTAGGGFHVYLSIDKEYAGTKLKKNLPKFPGIDFLSKGAQCVIAGSRIGDKEYSWHDQNVFSSFEQSPAPKKLLVLLEGQVPMVDDVKHVKTDDPFDGIVSNESGQWTDDKVTALLDKLDPSMENDPWVKVGMALHSYHPIDGLSMWENWSKAGTNYEAGECAKRWRSFDHDAGGVTMGSIVHMAKVVDYKKSDDNLTLYIDRVNKADKEDLELHVCPEIKKSDLGDADRDVIVSHVQNRLKEITGVKPRVATVRKMIYQLNKPKDIGAWANWVYINTHVSFAHKTTLKLYKTEAFNIINTHLIPVDENGVRPTAAKVVSDNGLIDVIDGIGYLPMLEKGTHIIDGDTILNTYDHTSVPNAADTFTDAGEDAIDTIERHLKMICVTDQHKDMLMMWIAHQVQYPGKLLGWAPLIQGIPGCGKSFIGELVRTLLSDKNVGTVSPTQVSSDFNGFAAGVCVNILEEISIKGHNRYEVTNALKPLLTDRMIQINEKKVKPYRTLNTANYILFTNDKNAIPIDDNDRRYWVLFAPFIDFEDFESRVKGDSAEYFEKLFNTLSQQAQIRKFFEILTITPEFKAMKRAPMTDDKLSMIATEESMLDGLDEVSDMIEEGGMYYCSEVVSSADLFDDLSQKQGGITMLTSKRNLILKRLGYTQMPKVLKIDGCTRRIWTKKRIGNAEVREIINAQNDKNLDF